MNNFTKSRRKMFAEFLLEDYRFYQQDMQQDDPEIKKAVSIIQEAIGAAYCELTQNNPDEQDAWVKLTGSTFPSVEVRQMEVPASIFQNLSRLSCNLHPDASLRIVSYKNQMYKVFQRRGLDFKLLATLTDNNE